MQGWVEQFYSGVLLKLWPGLQAIPLWPLYLVAILAGAAVMLGWLSFMGIVGTYGERRIAGFIQVRLGPNRVGPFGLLQPIADGIKLLGKEDIVPAVAFKILHILAPLIVLVGAFLPFAALPFCERLVVSDMPLALYYILAFEAIEVIGILMAGWAPGSKWSLYGGMRLAAQMLSYEIPMGLCILVIAFLAGSLNFTEIVKHQANDPVLFGATSNPIITGVLGWWIFRSPAAFVAFFVFFIGGMAATKRAPFDLPEAESELVAGYHTEYSGMRFAMFFMAEYASMYVICAAAAIVFLGGWHGPIPRPAITDSMTLVGQWSAAVATVPADAGLIAKCWALVTTFLHAATTGDGLRVIANQSIGIANLLMKAFFLYFVMIWVRWTLPRIRIDQVMYLCLKVLLPFSLACAVWAAIQVVL